MKCSPRDFQGGDAGLQKDSSLCQIRDITWMMKTQYLLSFIVVVFVNSIYSIIYPDDINHCPFPLLGHHPLLIVLTCTTIKCTYILFYRILIYSMAPLPTSSNKGFLKSLWALLNFLEGLSGTTSWHLGLLSEPNTY